MAAGPLEWCTKGYTAEISGELLQCESSTGSHGHINLGDILSVIPVQDSTSDYQVLYVAHDGENKESHGSLRRIRISSLPIGLSHAMTEIPAHLQNPEPVQVVVSTHSGTGAASAVFRDIVQPFFEFLGIEHRVHETESAETILELSRSLFLEKANAGIPQTILLLSGDGGLVDIVDVFYKSSIPVQKAPYIALIPCGTGNAMASSIGLRSGPVSGLMTLLKGRASPVPIFGARFSPGSRMVIDEGRQRVQIDNKNKNSEPIVYGAVVASWGLHAALVADSDTFEYRKFGAERFKMAANELLYPSDGTESHHFRGKITLRLPDGTAGKQTENTIADEEHMYVLATLVPRLEKEFLISPATKPLEGALRFLRFGPLPADEAMRLMTLAYQGGQHVQEQTVTYEEVEFLRIDFNEDQEKWRRVCIDGKIVAVEEGGWMELQKEPRQLLQLLGP